MTISRSRKLSPRTSKALIKRLGGTSAVSKVCRVSLAAVSQWKSGGIPEARVLFLKEKFKDLDYLRGNKEIQSF